MNNTFVDLETDVTFSQLNVWSAEQHMTSDRRCNAGVNGDVIGWKELENAEIEGAFIQVPSVCDGTLKTVMEWNIKMYNTCLCKALCFKRVLA